jgi:hypothetical protein
MLSQRGIEASDETIRCCSAREGIHAWIAFGRQHSMQALTRHGRQLGQLLEAQGCIHEIARNETRRFWLATQE